MLRDVWGIAQISVLVAAVLLSAIVPFLSDAMWLEIGLSSSYARWAVAIINGFLWLTVLYWIWRFSRLLISVRGNDRDLSLLSPFQFLDSALREVQRKERVFGLTFEVSEKAFFLNVNKILNITQEVLPLTSAELTLVDRSTKLYHGSFLAGSPFRTDIHSAYRTAETVLNSCGLRDVRKSYEQNRMILMLPVAVAGTELGLLRLGFKSEVEPSSSHWRVISIVLLQCSRALVEDDFTGRVLRMREGAELTIKSKTGFLAELSHEIRGPLGIMLNAVQLVLEEVCGSVNKDQRDTLSMAKQNGTHLLELVNDVLDFARAEAGRMPVEREAIKANVLMKDLTNVVLSLAGEKNHRLEFQPLANEALFLCGSRQARQILINLLINAIKYTPEGGHIQFVAEKRENGHLRINIKDNGIGIAARDHHKVFLPFERIESGYAKEQKGTGIGLSLTRELVQLNNGQIGFSSEEGAGAHFWVEFEGASEPEDFDLPDATEEADELNGSDITVLVVIPDSQESTMVVRYLTHHKFTVYEVEGLPKAHEVLVNETIQVIVLDLQLVKALDYTTQIEKLRASQNTDNKTGILNESPDALIIGVSGETFHSDIEDALRAGIDRCVTKPVSLYELGKACQGSNH